MNKEGYLETLKQLLYLTVKKGSGALSKSSEIKKLKNKALEMRSEIRKIQNDTGVRE